MIFAAPPPPEPVAYRESRAGAAIVRPVGEYLNLDFHPPQIRGATATYYPRTERGFTSPPPTAPVDPLPPTEWSVKLS